MTPAHDTSITCWQLNQQFLVLSQGGATPNRCVKCNAAANGFHLTHTYAPRLTPDRMIMGLFGAKREKITVRIALCPDHRARRTKWMRLWTASIVVGVLGLVAGFFLIAMATKSRPTSDVGFGFGITGVALGTLFLTMGIILLGVAWEPLPLGVVVEDKVALTGADETLLKSLPKFEAAKS